MAAYIKLYRKGTQESDTFADIDTLALRCRFRDCRHENEPGCALREAVGRGDLDPGRFANYLKLRDAEKCQIR